VKEKETMQSTLRTSIHPCTLLTPDKTNPDLFLCGCYELDEASQKRKGSLLFGQIREENLEVQHEVPTSSGVLDIVSHKDKLLVALSESTLEIWNRDGSSTSSASSIRKETEGLFLSVNSNLSHENAGEKRIVVSTQNGSVIVYRYEESSGSLEEESFLESAHQLCNENIPVYIANISPYDSNCVVSGGDDLKFKIWDLRSSLTKPEIICKYHDAGVTSLEWFPSPEQQHLFISGSYDERCALWDFRHLKTPLMEIETGGGAWRIKWMNHFSSSSSSSSNGNNNNNNNNEIDLKNQFISVCNMQHGSSIFQLNLETMTVEGSYCFSDDESEGRNPLYYGSEVIRRRTVTTEEGSGGGSGEKRMMEFEMISCSFYDNLIYKWKTSFPLIS
jgi:WD40 repeat protein